MPFIFVLLLSTNIVSPVLTVHLQQSEPETPKEMAVRIATEHGLNVPRFLRVIECESGWNVRAVGDNGTSFGLAQLHNVQTDWGMTKEEAFDPETALETMAKAWVRGLESKWTCWKLDTQPRQTVKAGS